MTAADKKDPEKLLNFFQSQLPQTVVNFRIHRLQLMDFAIKPNETIDSFVTRIRVFNQKCLFSEEQLAERIIELTIRTTPCDDFRKELLPKPEGFAIKTMLEIGRRYEAISQGAEQLKLLNMTDKPPESVEAIRYRRREKCKRCCTHHRIRACPAIKDECDYCGKVGHWEIACRLKKEDEAESDVSDSDDKPTHRKRINRQEQPKQQQLERKTRQRKKGRQGVHSVDYEDDEVNSDDPENFYTILD